MSTPPFISKSAELADALAPTLKEMAEFARECAIAGCSGVVQARGFCHRCYERLRIQGKIVKLPRVPINERFWRKVNKDGPVPEYAPSLGRCWIWMAARNPQTGYGMFDRNNYAHRWSYTDQVGAIPEGLELDHLCRVRECVRPSHLDPVTRAVHVRRSLLCVRTHCSKGHPFDDRNTYMTRSGRRRCRACDNDGNRRRNQR